jgi:hypothetical protein
MRRRVSAIANDVGLMEVTIGVALAFALVDLARAVGDTLVRWWQTPSPSTEVRGDDPSNGTILALENLFSDGAYEVGGRLLDLSLFVGAVIEVALVLALALWLWPRQAPERHGSPDRP